MTGYRLLIVGGIYQRAIDQFYARQPALSKATYDEQFNKYAAECIDISTFYVNNLNKLGWTAIEFVYPVEPLQKQWAREHDISFDEQNWNKQIISAQIKHFRPDVLYWGDPDSFEQSFRLAIRNDNPGIRLHISFKCSPVQNYDMLRDLDLMLTCTPTFVHRFENAGIKAMLLRHGFERSIIEKVGAQKKIFDFTFSGSLGSSFHTKRNDLVEDLLMSTPLEVWSYIKATDSRMRPRKDSGILGSTLLKVPQSITGRIPHINNLLNSIKRPPMNSIIDRFPGRIHDEVIGTDMYRLLAQSKISLNVHIDLAGKDAGSMRMFESTGMGSLLLTDDKDNIQDLFEPGKEVIVYKSTDECAEFATYYLEHDEERRAIAKAGQQNTLENHTYHHRAQELIEILQPLLKK